MSLHGKVTPQLQTVCSDFRVCNLGAATGGSVGLCFCPGKCVVRGGVQHKRSLQQDLTHLRERYAVTCILCLLNTAELRVSAYSCSCQSYSQLCVDRTNKSHSLMQVPTKPFWIGRALALGTMQQASSKLAYFFFPFPSLKWQLPPAFNRHTTSCSELQSSWPRVIMLQSTAGVQS